MTNETAKIKNGTFTLPKELRKSWKEADIFISGEKDTIFIKRLSKPKLSFKEMLNEFNEIGKNISRKTLDKAIGSVRNK
ncbi:hypothetical protein KKC65_02750 [Patescibacteria group bacterium]|nr:hypothetical protein [Patescibacteria group bacterium]